MTVLSKVGRLGAAAALIGALALPALADDTPSGKITFSGGRVAFIAGVNWGGGTLDFKGKHYAIKVSGLSAGDIGASKYSASGEVYNLKKASDIEGTYSAVEAGATAGGGAGAIEMKNANGVVIKATSTTQGLQLTLAPTGVSIKLK